ncbi:hypothetical protein [uncultured Maricaulis sp.]|uniref:hypothetical protein n=1 Tax=uncultured Maricaulis sp. TaxID=174710 RepID=UPI0030D8B631|tara:strand:+ start:9176 stop:9565 length:390 start_codon:yes stop_codon:yes gene_type:complete
MNKFVLAIMAASSLSLLGTSAFAMDHHMAGETAAPTHEACMTLHNELMADVAHGDTAARDAVIAGLDAETTARVEACHAMMGEMHQDGAADMHADGHADAHGNEHGHDAPAAEAAHDGEHEMHEAGEPQ